MPDELLLKAGAIEDATNADIILIVSVILIGSRS